MGSDSLRYVQPSPTVYRYRSYPVTDPRLTYVVVVVVANAIVVVIVTGRKRKGKIECDDGRLRAPRFEHRIRSPLTLPHLHFLVLVLLQRHCRNYPHHHQENRKSHHLLLTLLYPFVQKGVRALMLEDLLRPVVHHHHHRHHHHHHHRRRHHHQNRNRFVHVVERRVRKRCLDKPYC
ncbi:hypothetical protein B0F90DRAFT_1746473 [Multifurca ochricompacta]|uniref:Uncharacterized protein n=1 Tax=Multifurca ochricompacta TaxID=376703 RepID=A0AAD4M1K2_9AGAM|nr:hypothetical protein B0F90DRAFT_1746473 [Multifurca ochricompacta]